VARLKRLYESWEENPNIGFVLMKGSGRAFCLGGDVVTLYHLLTEGRRVMNPFIYLAFCSKHFFSDCFHF
ncbi:hypothetical protein ACJRO7_015329, partial [Eucalyptus globulus]